MKIYVNKGKEKNKKFMILPEKIYVARFKKYKKFFYEGKNGIAGGITLFFDILNKKYKGAMAFGTLWTILDDEERPIIRFDSEHMLYGLAGRKDLSDYDLDDSINEKYKIYVKPIKKGDITFNTVMEILPYNIDDESLEKEIERIKLNIEKNEQAMKKAKKLNEKENDDEDIEEDDEDIDDDEEDEDVEEDDGNNKSEDVDEDTDDNEKDEDEDIDDDDDNEDSKEEEIEEDDDDEFEQNRKNKNKKDDDFV